MKAVAINRAIIVGALVALSGLSSVSCRAGTLQILQSIEFPFPEQTMNDLAWDGQSLLFAINWGFGARIYALRPGQGSAVRERTPGVWFCYGGLAWDGRYLWATGQPAITAPAAEVPDFLGRIDLDAILAPGMTTYGAPYSPEASQWGAAWDGAYLWLSDAKHAEIMQVDPANMSVVRSFSSPGPMPLGLAWAQSSLWCVDGAERRIYQFDPSGDMIETWFLPVSAPSGLTFDGANLWVADNDTRKLYQLAIPEPSSLALLAATACTLFCFGWSRQRGARSTTGRCVSQCSGAYLTT